MSDNEDMKYRKGFITPEDERQAWDRFVTAYAVKTGYSPTEVAARADALILERRKRFGVENG